MILVDSNIPMYLVGADHPNKHAARSLLETAVGDGERLVADVEVLQEILHRYRSIDRREAIQPAFDALLGVVDEVAAVELGYPLSARDALHLAVMDRLGVRTVSFDRGFDAYPGITRRH